MSQIRFGGSVASATLSAHWALPGGDIQLPCDPSTAADSAVGSDHRLWPLALFEGFDMPKSNNARIHFHRDPIVRDRSPIPAYRRSGEPNSGGARNRSKWPGQAGDVTVARSQAITSSMMAGPSGSLWSS
jgi:hypothetical protein